MGKAKKAKGPTPVAVVKVIPAGDEFALEIESDLTPETVAAILRAAADDIEGKDDRAAGAWGR